MDCRHSSIVNTMKEKYGLRMCVTGLRLGERKNMSVPDNVGENRDEKCA